MMLEILFSLEKKKKKKYNDSIMAELRRPPVRLNLGGKTLGGIVEGLGNLGWATKDLPTADMDIMMIHGNTQRAEFWHTPPNTITDTGAIIFHGSHKDTLLYANNNSLARDCPTYGLDIIATVTRG